MDLLPTLWISENAARLWKGESVSRIDCLNATRVFANAATITTIFLGALLTLKLLAPSAIALTGLVLSAGIRAAFAAEIAEHIQKLRSEAESSARVIPSRIPYSQKVKSAKESEELKIPEGFMYQSSLINPAELHYPSMDINLPEGATLHFEWVDPYKDDNEIIRQEVDVQCPKDWQSACVRIGKLPILWSLIPSTSKALEERKVDSQQSKGSQASESNCLTRLSWIPNKLTGCSQGCYSMIGKLFSFQLPTMPWAQRNQKLVSPEL